MQAATRGGAMLDERTIMVAAVVAQVLMALLSLAVRRSQGQFALGLGHWAFGMAAMSAGAIGTMLSAGSLTRSTLAINNAFYISGMALLGFGVLRFLGRQPRPWLWIAFAAFIYVAGVLLSASPEQVPWRISVFMLLQVAVGALALEALVRNRNERGLGAVTLLGSMLLLIGAGLARVGFALAGLASVRLLAGSSVSWSFVGAVSLAQVLATIGLILVTGERAQRRLRELASHDSLTGLLTRGGFNQFAQQVIATARREVKHVGFLMIDIDHFKQINDRYGHDAGDQVLAEVAKRLDMGLREIDIVSRYGGEEFAVLLPSSEPTQTALAAERLRQAVEQSEFSLGDTTLKVTVSIGTANAPPADAHIEKLYKKAEQALYRAKRGGRNQVIAAN